MLIDGRVLLNEQISRRHIGLGLVVIVVRNEVLHSVARKELTHLGVQLRGQGFIGRQDNGWTPRASNNVGHRVGLA